jgi:hypothetical protein
VASKGVAVATAEDTANASEYPALNPEKKSTIMINHICF